MNSKVLAFCNSRWILLGISMDENAPRKEKIRNYLVNLYNYTAASLLVSLTLAHLALHYDTLPADTIYFMILQYFSVLSFAGLYIGAAPKKCKVYNLVMTIDEICYQRRNEFNEPIYAKAEKDVYLLNRVLLPFDLTLFFGSYFLNTVIFAIYFGFFSDNGIEYEKLFHLMYYS